MVRWILENADALKTIGQFGAWLLVAAILYGLYKLVQPWVRSKIATEKTQAEARIEVDRAESASRITAFENVATAMRATTSALEKLTDFFKAHELEDERRHQEQKQHTSKELQFTRHEIRNYVTELALSDDVKRAEAVRKGMEERNDPPDTPRRRKGDRP